MFDMRHFDLLEQGCANLGEFGTRAGCAFATTNVAIRRTIISRTFSPLEIILTKAYDATHRIGHVHFTNNFGEICVFAELFGKQGSRDISILELHSLGYTPILGGLHSVQITRKTAENHTKTILGI